MSLRDVIGDVVLASTARGSGTYTSGPVSVAGSAADALVLVHVTAASGTPSLAVSLEQSADGSTWTAVGGSSAPALTAIGNAMSNAQVTGNFVRVTATVSGTTPNMTFRVACMVFAA